MNKIDQKLHEAIHSQMMNTDPNNIFSDRVKVFGYVEKALGVKIHGNVLDIGCGSGYASIWLAKNKPVSKVYAQEASQQAVEELLPRNIHFHGVSDKVEALAGSFDAIPFNKALDFVISFGALHHSACLYSTMKSIGLSLKDGGYLIAQEPVMPNMTSNQDYIDKYNIIEERFGMKIRNGDRNDNFFREAEYIVAAAFSGLDLVMYEPYVKREPSKSIRNFIGKTALKRYAYKVFCSIRGNKDMLNNDLPAYKYQREVKPKILVFKKHTTDYIPHIWRDLDQST